MLTSLSVRLIEGLPMRKSQAAGRTPPPPIMYPWQSAIVIGLSLGGILLSVRSVSQGWRRLRRHARRLRLPS